MGQLESASGELEAHRRSETLVGKNAKVHVRTRGLVNADG